MSSSKHWKFVAITCLLWMLTVHKLHQCEARWWFLPSEDAITLKKKQKHTKESWGESEIDNKYQSEHKVFSDELPLNIPLYLKEFVNRRDDRWQLHRKDGYQRDNNNNNKSTTTHLQETDHALSIYNFIQEAEYEERINTNQPQEEAQMLYKSDHHYNREHSQQVMLWWEKLQREARYSICWKEAVSALRNGCAAIEKDHTQKESKWYLYKNELKSQNINDNNIDNDDKDDKDNDDSDSNEEERNLQVPILRSWLALQLAKCDVEVDGRHGGIFSCADDLNTLSQSKQRRPHLFSFTSQKSSPANIIKTCLQSLPDTHYSIFVQYRLHVDVLCAHISEEVYHERTSASVFQLQSQFHRSMEILRTMDNVHVHLMRLMETQQYKWTEEAKRLSGQITEQLAKLEKGQQATLEKLLMSASTLHNKSEQTQRVIAELERSLNSSAEDVAKLFYALQEELNKQYHTVNQYSTHLLRVVQRIESIQHVLVSNTFSVHACAMWVGIYTFEFLLTSFSWTASARLPSYACLTLTLITPMLLRRLLPFQVMENQTSVESTLEMLAETLSATTSTSTSILWKGVWQHLFHLSLPQKLMQLYISIINILQGEWLQKIGIIASFCIIIWHGWQNWVLPTRAADWRSKYVKTSNNTIKLHEKKDQCILQPEDVNQQEYDIYHNCIPKSNHTHCSNNNNNNNNNNNDSINISNTIIDTREKSNKLNYNYSKRNEDYYYNHDMSNEKSSNVHLWRKGIDTSELTLISRQLVDKVYKNGQLDVYNKHKESNEGAIEWNNSDYTYSASSIVPAVLDKGSVENETSLTKAIDKNIVHELSHLFYIKKYNNNTNNITTEYQSSNNDDDDDEEEDIVVEHDNDENDMREIESICTEEGYDNEEKENEEDNNDDDDEKEEEQEEQTILSSGAVEISNIISSVNSTSPHLCHKRRRSSTASTISAAHISPFKLRKRENISTRSTRGNKQRKSVKKSNKCSQK